MLDVGNNEMRDALFTPGSSQTNGRERAEEWGTWGQRGGETFWEKGTGESNLIE